MTDENLNNGALLQEIHPSQLTPKQVARWKGSTDKRTYRLRRKPVNLKELSEYGKVAIWKDDDETLIYCMPDGTGSYSRTDDHEYLELCFFRNGPTWRVDIVGESDDAIAQIAKTAAFVMGLAEPTDEISDVYLGQQYRDGIDFSAAGTNCLTHIFEAISSHDVHLEGLFLSIEQSVALATMPTPIQLSFVGCQFEDEGTAFVDELLKHESSFGSLELSHEDCQSIPFDDDNLKRLLEGVDAIDYLGLLLFLENKEIALLPFSAKVNTLDYCMDIGDPSTALDTDFQSLNIVASKLSLRFSSWWDDYPTDFMVSFWRRVAELGHFVELEVFISQFADDFLFPDTVVPAVISAALANRNLKVLGLCGENAFGPQLEALFDELKDHQELHTLKIDAWGEDFGPDYSYLRKFLSHHRNITVTDEYGRLHSDGRLVDELYSLNRFYRGSTGLAVEPPLERPLLVATGLVERASGDFQRTSLLLSNHVDVLHDLVEFASEAGEENVADPEVDSARSDEIDQFSTILVAADDSNIVPENGQDDASLVEDDSTANIDTMDPADAYDEDVESESPTVVQTPSKPAIDDAAVRQKLTKDLK